MGRDELTRKPSARSGMSHRRKAFVAQYLACFNATEAARKAGYTGTVESIRVTGHRLLSNASVQRAIQRRLAKMGMAAAEVIARLVQHATADVGDFLDIRDDGSFAVNLKKAADLGKLHLIHEISFTEHGPKLKLHDAQKALELLGKLHKLFTEKHEHTGPGGAPLVLKVKFDEDRTALNGDTQ